MNRSRKLDEKLLAALTKQLGSLRVGGTLPWTLSLRVDRRIDDANGLDRPELELTPQGEARRLPVTLGQLDIPNRQATIRSWSYTEQAFHLRGRGHSVPLDRADYEQMFEHARSILTQFGFRVMTLSADSLPKPPVSRIVPPPKQRDTSKYVRPLIVIVAVVVIVEVMMYALKILEKSSGLD